METHILEDLRATVNAESLRPYAEIAGEDPVFPLPWRVGEAGQAEEIEFH